MTDLQAILRDAIELRVDVEALERLRRREMEERQRLVADIEGREA